MQALICIFFLFGLAAAESIGESSTTPTNPWWIVVIFFGVAFIISVAVLVLARISCLHDQGKCLKCNADWCKSENV